MQVYISADIEGVAGATHWNETNSDHKAWTEFREQMTAEVAAACEGALQAGADAVWVKDAHGSGRNIIPGKLPREVRLVRDWSDHPYLMMQELDDTFDAVMMVGYHSRAGSDAAPLAHTISGSVATVKINDRYASEFLLNAYTAGLVGVPVVFLSGDEGVCAEAQALVADLTAVATMRGVGASTISIHPALAADRIRSGAEQALRGDLARCQVTLPEHFSVEVRYKGHARAYRASFYPGASLKEPSVVGFQAEDYFDVLRFLMFGIIGG
jgi:D-amino peptidase